MYIPRQWPHIIIAFFWCISVVQDPLSPMSIFLTPVFTALMIAYRPGDYADIDDIIQSHDEIIVSDAPKTPDFTSDHFDDDVRIRKLLLTLPQGEYIYVIRDVSLTGAYKIGRTNQPRQRLRIFDVRLPFEVQYVHVQQVTDSHKSEGELHGYFKDKRLSGEWFRLALEDIEEIKRLLKDM